MATKQRIRILVLAAVCGLTLVGPRDTDARQDANAQPQAATNAAPAQAEATEPNDSKSITNSPTATAQEESSPARTQDGMDRGPLVSIGRDVELKAGDSAQAVVVIFGSAKVRGNVRDAAVAIFGDLDVEGEVGEAAVAVMGNLKVGPNAKINGEAVVVGGKMEAADTAKIVGQPVIVQFPDGLQKWFYQCFLKMRPLAPQVGWVWWVAGIIFLLYLLIAAAFPRPVGACINELSRRPATTFLMGLLTKLLLPLVLVVLSATVIGLIVVPFIIPALFLAAIVGKVALLEWLGLRLGRSFAGEGFEHRLIAYVIGAVIITLLYMVPVLGMLTFGVTSVWGLGAAVTAAFGGLRKEMPEKPAPAMPMEFGEPAMAGAGQGTSAQASSVGGMPSAEFAGTSSAKTGVASDISAMPNVPLNVPETLAYPRAGFWERMAAGFLDVVLVGLLGALLARLAPLVPLVALAYFAGMWAWKGTTIGGIVLGLKVVRFDGQPVSFAAALVRALGAAFSTVVFFLGFLWIAWDKEKQGWHDKIAGTVVLKLPRGTPLV